MGFLRLGSLPVNPTSIPVPHLSHTHFLAGIRKGRQCSKNAHKMESEREGKRRGKKIQIQSHIFLPRRFRLGFLFSFLHLVGKREEKREREKKLPWLTERKKDKLIGEGDRIHRVKIFFSTKFTSFPLPTTALFSIVYKLWDEHFHFIWGTETYILRSKYL